jgi:REP element-mobilizing transposase RayT
MLAPMIGHHIIFGAYGFWLPNDPRGSWSEFVGSWELYRYGPATKTNETSSLARRPHDRALRLAAKQALQRPAAKFTGIQARAIGRGFAEYVQRSGLVVWACAILPDHIHLVVGCHRLRAEQIVIQLKGEATKHLVAEGIHPFQPLGTAGRPPKCFARGEWKVYLDPEDVSRAIPYVEGNPPKEGKPRQTWPFVVPYAG